MKSHRVIILLAGVCTLQLQTAEAIEKVSLSNELWTGAVAWIGTPDRVVLKRSWGWMDKAREFPIHENAIFDLASVTKAVGTTTAVALCIDRGLIDPDTVFTNYLPVFKRALAGPITVRDLARHISGFDNSKPYAIEGKVQQRILNISPVRPARTAYDYSCANFILLGLVVEKVTGGNLADFCRENIFCPLKMEHTYWMSVPDPDSRNVVRQAICGTLGIPSDGAARQAGAPIGNAGMFATAGDLSVFCRMILSDGMIGKKRVLSENVIRLLKTCPDHRSPVAFGWRVNPKFNPPLLSSATMSHTGWSGNSVWIDPLQKRYVIILTNRIGDHSEADKARLQFAQDLLCEINQEQRGH